MLILFIVITMTGALASPFLILVICRIVLAGILLPPTATFLYAGITLAALGLLGILLHFSKGGILFNHWQAILLSNGWRNSEVIVDNIALGVAILFSAYLISSVRGGSKKRGGGGWPFPENLKRQTPNSWPCMKWSRISANIPT